MDIFGAYWGRKGTHRVEKKLLAKTVVYVAVGLTAFCVAVWATREGGLAPAFAILPLAVGLAVGTIVALTADVVHEQGVFVEVRGRTGKAVLIAYIVLVVVFIVVRGWLFGHWLEGVQITALTTWVVSGLMLSQAALIRFRLRRSVRRTD